MKTPPSEFRTPPAADPEAALQRDQNLHGESRAFHLFIFCLVAALALYDRAALSVRAGLNPFTRWFRWRRECSWCKAHLGGNPWARRITHGICRPCEDKFLADTAIFNSNFNHGPVTQTGSLRAEASSAAASNRTHPATNSQPTPAGS